MVWTAGVARAARRIATAAALGGGGLTLLGAATYALLMAEARLARKTVGRRHGLAGPPADGVYGEFPGSPGHPEGPLRMVMLGDSTAIGLGMTSADQTPGALLANGLAAVAKRPVRLSVVGRSGAASIDLAEQVDAALAARPHIAVIFIGANDVATKTLPAQAVRHLREAVHRLRQGGAEVVVGTCPDLGTIRPIAQPLRWVTRRWSRQLAAAQTVAVVEAGGRTVAFADVLGPEFDAFPGEMFGPDRYHPSARGYLQAAYAVLPSVCAALGLWPESEPEPEHGDGTATQPIHVAAAMAAEESGTQVRATRLRGRAVGPQGRWARLLRQSGPTPHDA